MTKGKELAKNTLIIGFGKIVGQGASFLLLPLYTFFLKPEEFGYTDLVLTYSAIIIPTVLLQLDRAAFRFLVEVKGRQQKANIIRNSFQIAIISGTIIAVVYLIASRFIKIPYAELILLAVVFNFIHTYSIQLARGLGYNKIYAKASILYGVLMLAITSLFVAVLSMKADGILLATTLSYALTTIYVWIKADIRKYITQGKKDVPLRKEMLKYSLPLIPSNISWWVIGAANRTIIASFLGVAANGLYAVAFRYASILGAIYSIFDMSWTESAARHIDSKNRDQFFSKTLNTSIGLFGSLGAIYILVMSVSFQYLIGLEFADSYAYIPPLVISTILSSTVSSFSVIYLAKKATSKVMITAITTAIISLALNLAFIPIFGLPAAAASSMVAYGLMAVFRYFDVQKYVTFKYDIKLLLLLSISYALSVFAYYIGNLALTALIILVVSIFALIINKDLISATLAEIKNKTKK